MKESRKSILFISIFGTATAGVFIAGEFSSGYYWIVLLLVAMVAAVLAAFAVGRDFKRKVERNPESVIEEFRKQRLALYWTTGLLLLWIVFSAVDYLVSRNAAGLHQTATLVPVWLFVLLSLERQSKVFLTRQQGAGRNAG